MDKTENKILITGSSGFVGKNLVRKFADLNIKYEILDRQRYPFNNIKKLKKIFTNKSYIIHLAGQTRGDNQTLIDANTLSTLHILEAISDLEVKPRLIYASSFAVYAPSRRILTEKSALKPRNIYGLSKLWSEELIENFTNIHNLESIILRISNIYGPNVPPFAQSVISTFIHQAKTDQVINVGHNGSQTRDFIHVDDVVNAIIKATEISLKEYPLTVNISSNNSVSMNKLLEKISVYSEKKLNINYNKTPEVGLWVGKNSKAKKVLKWSPQINFDDALLSLCKN